PSVSPSHSSSAARTVKVLDPVRVMAPTVTGVPPLLVTLKVVVLVPRNTTWPKSCGLGVTDTAAGCGVAWPASGTLTVGLAEWADRTLSVPDLKPDVPGPNSMLTVQLSPSPRVSPQVVDAMVNGPLITKV